MNDFLSAATGPVGAVVLAIGAAYILIRMLLALWQEHLEADRDDRRQRDEAVAALRLEQENNAAHAEAGRKMAGAWDKRNDNDAARIRRGDRS